MIYEPVFLSIMPLLFITAFQFASNFVIMFHIHIMICPVYYRACHCPQYNTVNPHNEGTNIRPNAGLAGVGFKGYIIACPL